MEEITRFKADMLKWTTPEGQKLFWSSEIATMLSYFFLMPKAKRLPFLTFMASHLTKCRCCIILQKKMTKSTMKLFLTAGYPNDGLAHGLGIEITPVIGGDFLMKIIREGNIVIVRDSLNDKRVAYMKDMIVHLGIQKQLFVPLFLKRLENGFEISPFGVLVFDSTQNENDFNGKIALVKKIAQVAVALIISEERRQKMDCDLARVACSNALNEHSTKGFEDEFRNTPVTLGANARKLWKILTEINKDFPENKDITSALKYTREIVEITSKFSKKASDFLSAIKIKTSSLDIQEHDLKKFAEFVVKEFAKEKNSQQQEIGVNIRISRLAKNRKARFDWKKMAICLHTIMDNAVKYEADIIWLKFSIKQSEAGELIMIMVSNNGAPMSQRTADQLLQYFSSTDRKTGGGGLTIANAIVEAHGGKIEPRIKPLTQFVIQLPI
jgi:signal transduction histidine kinase